MRFAIDPSGIALSTTNRKLDSAISSSVIALSKEIYEEYVEAVETDGTGFFKDFLAWLISDPENHYKIPNDLISKYFQNSESTEKYALAAYFNGNKHITGEAEGAKKIDDCKNLGIELIDAMNFETKKKRNQGTNILDVIDISSATKHDNNLILHYFANETRVVIYDRYLKPASLSLIVSISKKIKKHAELIIISEFNSGVTSDECIRACKPSTATTKTYFPNFSEANEWHDRHIHLGDRLHITFSSGTDCFGTPPMNLNRECQITIYHTAEINELKTYHVKTTTNKTNTKIHTTAKKITSASR
ncbi:hypothetical protein [Pseudomonas peli]|uniref:hypothetical protein n=1 Tax=Pseudomonas peli TaxID=592361 RepID=UPI003D3109FB